MGNHKPQQYCMKMKIKKNNCKDMIKTSLVWPARNRLPWLRIVGAALPPMAYIRQFM
jgi:hypothetical protein